MCGHSSGLPHPRRARSRCFSVMGGATFFFKAEDMMNPESWSSEDFVTPRMCCPKSLLVPFVGVGAAQVPGLLGCFCVPGSLSVKAEDRSPAGWPCPFSTFLVSVYTCSGEQGTKLTVVHVTNFVPAFLVSSGLPVTWREQSRGVNICSGFCVEYLS